MLFTTTTGPQWPATIRNNTLDVDSTSTSPLSLLRGRMAMRHRVENFTTIYVPNSHSSCGEVGEFVCWQWQNALINIPSAIYVPKCPSYFNILAYGKEFTKSFEPRNVYSSDISIYEELPRPPTGMAWHLVSSMGDDCTLITNNNTATKRFHTLSPSWGASTAPCAVKVGGCTRVFHGQSLQESFELFLIIPCLRSSAVSLRWSSSTLSQVAVHCLIIAHPPPAHECTTWTAFFQPVAGATSRVASLWQTTN